MDDLPVIFEEYATDLRAVVHRRLGPSQNTGADPGR
jgi:hypothetical protein